MSLPSSTALFDDQASALNALRADIALGAAAYLPAASIADDTLLWTKLVAAEAQAERLLKCFFSAVQVVPDDADPSEIQAFEDAGTRYVQESAYDFEGDMFYPDKFGFIPLCHRPVQMINSVIIVTPTPFLSNFSIPSNWFRLNKKYGQLRFYPSTSEVTTMTNYGIGFMSGASFPNAVQVRYVTGLQNADGSLPSSAAIVWPDLIEVVKKMAILSMLQTSVLPNSASISADGLSQSKSIDMAKWQEIIDILLFGGKGSNGGLFTSIHGVNMGVI